MSVALATPPHPWFRAAVALGLWALASGLQAQQAATAPPAADHLFVVTRTVQPRIAYRGIPLEDNPVRVQATTFPGRVFHQTVDAAMERLVGDGDLDRLGSAGVGSESVMHAVLTGELQRSGAPALLGGMASTANTPLGASASGAVSRTTSGLGGLINTNLLPALGSQSGGGR